MLPTCEEKELDDRLQVIGVKLTKYSRSFLLQDRSWTQKVRISHHQGSFHCGDRTSSNQTQMGVKEPSNWRHPWTIQAPIFTFVVVKKEANVRRMTWVQPLGGMSACACKDVADEIHIPLQTSEKCWAFNQLIGGMQRRHWWLSEEDRELNHCEPPIHICKPPRQIWLRLLNILESKSCYASFPSSWTSFVPVSRGRLRTALSLREGVTLSSSKASWGRFLQSAFSAWISPASVLFSSSCRSWHVYYWLVLIEKVIESQTPDYSTQDPFFFKVCTVGGKRCAPSISSYVSVGNLFQHFDLQRTIKDD